MTKRILLIALTILILGVLFYYAKNRLQERDNFIPDTISKEAQQALAKLFQIKIYALNTPNADDKAAWQKLHAEYENNMAADNMKAAADNQVTIKETTIGKIPVLDIKPKGWKENHKVIVYLHGGAYTMFSPKSSLVLSAPVSRATGQRIISVGYTTAPFADWQQIQMEVITVIKSLLTQGYRMQDIVMYGDSAGGGLVMNVVLQLRDQGAGIPAALILLAPWSDLTNRGDTMQTLANADPILTYDNMLLNCAQAYAHGLNLNDPRISPLYADFSKGFPPTLIIDGTRSIFLSSSVRLYQALDNAKQKVLLDMHEGMWHGFLDTPSPETDTALNKINMFISLNAR